MTIRAIRLGGPALVGSLLVIALSTAPVLAHTVISQTGLRGTWALQDTQRRPGATCDYNIYGDLYQVKIKPPTVESSHAAATWVGWKYQILRRGSSGWRVIEVSNVQRDMATSSAAADGFTWRTWDNLGVDPPANGRYKVRILILFYAPGSSTTVEGKVVVEDDWYKETYPSWSQAYKHAEYCSNNPD